MLLISELSQLPILDSGTVVTMGDFDGLHVGHQQLIRETVDCSRRQQLPSVLLTFEPSPKKLLKKLPYDSRLTPFAEKKELLSATSIDIVIFYPTTEATLRISARNFLRHFLLQRLKMRHIIVGRDHHFGHNRRGNVNYLLAAAKRYGFVVQVVDDYMALDGRSSSSRIRAALAAGDVVTAAAILGRYYSVRGVVVRGQGIGKSLGFPTANLAFDPEKLLPATGVYYGIAALPDGSRCAGVANLGYRPTLGVHPLGLEIHLPDFQGDLYGRALEFFFIERLRSEKRFANTDELQRQIAADVANARQKFMSHS
ncbi:MAG: bifunctional riboflavin kinase/FAD synthetase [Turneriella sp.]|nr:bifunctional riboflavin kinase/FAD synthetase [Turneriella sp.]